MLEEKMQAHQVKQLQFGKKERNAEPAGWIVSC